jgi:hypothetical protein
MFKKALEKRISLVWTSVPVPSKQSSSEEGPVYQLLNLGFENLTDRHSRRWPDHGAQ